MMRTAPLAVGLIGLCACAGSASSPPPRSSNGKPVFTDLGEVVMVNDLDTEFPQELRYGGGGGLSMEMMFVEGHYPQLRVCMARVRELADQWAAKNRLPPLKDERSPTRLLLHYRSQEPPGLFEVVYRIHRPLGAVHAYFGFYDDRMRRLEADTVRSFIQQFGLDDFVGKLRVAVQCEQGEAL